MVDVSSLWVVYRQVKTIEKSCRQLDADIAIALGWRDVQYKKFGKGWKGIPPGNNRPAVIPSFTGSVDAVISIVPDRWIESYYRRFDGIVRAECHPRGDLRIFTTPIGESRETALALLQPVLMAHIYTKEKESCPTKQLLVASN